MGGREIMLPFPCVALGLVTCGMCLVARKLHMRTFRY